MAAGPDVLTPTILHRIDEEVHSICEALDTTEEANHMVEAGIDLVLDEEFEPWLIEINSDREGVWRSLLCPIQGTTEPLTSKRAHDRSRSSLNGEAED